MYLLGLYNIKSLLYPYNMVFINYHVENYMQLNKTSLLRKLEAKC